MTMPKNPYGGKPGGGITLPDYFTPTPNLATNNNYFPTSETLGPDEMRVTFVGSCPYHLISLQFCGIFVGIAYPLSHPMRF